MAISFDIFPSHRRASMRQIELVGKKRSTAGAYIPEKILIPGQYLAAKTGVTVGEIKHLYTADEVGDWFGYGSEIHRQAVWIYAALGGFSENVYCVGCTAATGNAAALAITITGDATSSGSLYFSIAGNLYQISVAPGDTDDEIATALVAAITADIAAPYTAAVGGAGSTNIVTCTAKNSGLNGNSMYAMMAPDGVSQSSLAPSGPAVTFATSGYFAGGTGSIDIDDALYATGVDKLANEWITLIAAPFQDDTNIGKLKTYLTSRMNMSPSRLAGSVIGYVKKSYADALAVPATINSKHIATIWDARSLAPDIEFGAAVLGQIAYSATLDPGRPFVTLPLGVPVKAGIFDNDYARNDALFRAGIGYCKLDASGDMILGDVALSYRLTAAGAATEEWFDMVSLTRRQVKAYQAEQTFLSDPYTRGMVGSDDIVTAKDYVIKPKKVLADIYALIDNWTAEGWTKNPAVVKATAKAEINATNQSRIDAELTDDEAAALRIIALKLAFLY